MGSANINDRSQKGDGDSEIANIEMALRGYNRLVEKLEALGCKISIDRQ